MESCGTIELNVLVNVLCKGSFLYEREQPCSLGNSFRNTPIKFPAPCSLELGDGLVKSEV